MEYQGTPQIKTEKRAAPGRRLFKGENLDFTSNFCVFVVICIQFFHVVSERLKNQATEKSSQTANSDREPIQSTVQSESSPKKSGNKK